MDSGRRQRLEETLKDQNAHREHIDGYEANDWCVATEGSISGDTSGTSALGRLPFPSGPRARHETERLIGLIWAIN